MLYNYFEDGPILVSSDNNINNALAEENAKDPERKTDDVTTITTNKSHFTQDQGSSIMTITLTKMKAKHKYGQKRKSAIQTLKNNKDLNNILDGIDDLAKDKGVPLLDRNNLVFIIERKQLDKLKTKNNDNFKVKYIYQLLKNKD